MFYRRKLLLALLYRFGRLGPERLQALLFLLSRAQMKPDFDFAALPTSWVSFQLEADVATLLKAGWLDRTEAGYSVVAPAETLPPVKAADREVLQSLLLYFEEKSQAELSDYLDKNYPLPEPGSSGETDEIVLFTIGYEGINLETYINKLLEARVLLLCDVRRNPFSLKFGYSKRPLEEACSRAGIQYAHFPELGIASELRQGIGDSQDRVRLFAYYRQESLPHTIATQRELVRLLEQHRRIALTCFEANHQDCHRSHLADALGHLPEFHYPVRHI